VESFVPRRWNGRFTRALVLEDPSPILDDSLRRLGIEPHRVPDAPDEESLVKILAEGQHQLIFKRSRVLITEPVLQASRDLAAVMLCCIGDDSVDKEACARHGVLVTNDPVSNGRSVAELVIGELIALSRRIFDAIRETDASVWIKSSRDRFEVLGKRIGIVGLGNIGRQVAQLAQALGMEVYFYDDAVIPREVGLAMGYRACESIGQLIETCHFVTVHVSANDSGGRSNEGLFTYELLRNFAKHEGNSPRIFINLSRGFLVAPGDLRRAVTEGLISYAITDVFPDEPRAAVERGWANPYAGEPRIFATPHIGASTLEAQPRIARYVARTTELLHRFGMLRNCVFRPRAAIDFEVPPEAHHMLAVVHVDKRGTKKAVDDAIYNAGASNLRSSHIDFPQYGVAYDLSALDRPLSDADTTRLVTEASELTGDPQAIRYVRAIPLRG